MSSLWFIVPAAGRVDLTRVCLRQLRRTCDALTENGVRATAVVVADDENLDTAQALGFGTVERDNEALGRRWNDGYELAALCGADYVVPLGSDDWIDPYAILAAPLPGPAEIRCFRQAAVVREDGERLMPLRVWWDGGVGVRIIPTELLEPLGYRPADEDRARMIDASVLARIKRAQRVRPRLVYHDSHPLQIVDWKSAGAQLNSYEAWRVYGRGGEEEDVWGALADVYPAESVDEMRAVYDHGLVAAY